jgi:hypothetical protein
MTKGPSSFEHWLLHPVELILLAFGPEEAEPSVMLLKFLDSDKISKNELHIV